MAATKLGTMIAIAASAHELQVDKQGKPYILHCLKVMHYLRSDDEPLNCIAVGHDLLEDTDYEYQDILAIFGLRIAEGILALTKRQGQSYEDYKQQVKANRDACLVKMADLRHNMDIRRLKGITQKDFERTQKYMQFYEDLKELVNEKQ